MGGRAMEKPHKCEGTATRPGWYTKVINAVYDSFRFTCITLISCKRQKNYKDMYSSSIDHQTEKGNFTIASAQMFLVRQYRSRQPFNICPLNALQLWNTIVRSANVQYSLNSHTFFIFWFIWWTRSRKVVIDNMSSFSCLAKTWSNHVYC